jgi:hypothetical protein
MFLAFADHDCFEGSGQVFCRMSFRVGLVLVHVLAYMIRLRLCVVGLAKTGESPGGEEHFSSLHIEDMFPQQDLPVVIDLDHLAKVVSAAFLHNEANAFPFYPLFFPSPLRGVGSFVRLHFLEGVSASHKNISTDLVASP